MSRNIGIEIVKLIICLALCQLAGLLGSLATTPNIPTWYAELDKPTFTPPNWLFSPVWITLYVLMGVAAYLVWRRGLSAPKVKPALLLFIIQLALNSTWSVVFFGLHSPFYGFIVIIALWVLILLTTIYFFKISKPAGILMLPYILWVSFAVLLNWGLYRLNV